MQTNSSKKRFGLRQAIYLLLALGFFSAVAQAFNVKTDKSVLTTVIAPEMEENISGDEPLPAPTSDQRAEESKKAFLKAYTVFMHPRCMNCHPKGDVPLQGDDSHLHAQNVQRGKDGKGLYALKCKNCHQDANLAGFNMPPGSKEWHLPPADKKMVFEGSTPRQLALHFKNNQFTGFKSLNDMIHHVEKEPLVLNSFIPIPGRAKIPMSHEEFVDAVKEWIAKGAAVPE